MYINWKKEVHRNMKRKLIMLICLLMTVCLLPLNAFAGLYLGPVVRITSNSAVNVRAEPTKNSRMLGEAMSTNIYTLLDTEGDWYKIQFTSEIQGYVPTRYSAIEEAVLWDEFHPAEVEAVVRNTHYNALNVRREPDKESASIGSIEPDSTYPFFGTENGWHRIMYNGVYAYVAANRSEVEITRYYPTYDIGDDLVKGGTPCDECEGSGECYPCRGRGYIFSTVEQEDIDCPTCCGLAFCYFCQGTGYR